LASGGGGVTKTSAAATVKVDPAVLVFREKKELFGKKLSGTDAFCHSFMQNDFN
jgi:hypothetical protein